MNADLFRKRLSWRYFVVCTSAGAAGLPLAPGSNASGETAKARNPCCFSAQESFFYIPDLASRVTTLGADHHLAPQLGDGKETDGTTNRPDCQTNPALFAAPHAFTVH
jgi:hypothetical protein